MDESSVKEVLIRDPIHGFINISIYPFIKEIMENPYFQRLRRLSQLGVSMYVYPSATHNRFNHTLGAMHLFGKIFNNLFRQKNKKYKELQKIGIATILLHDIGHGPLSHATESIFNYEHEKLSIEIIESEMKNILEREDIDIERVTSILAKKPHETDKILSQLIDSSIDVDRLDYLARDIYFTGVGFGQIDLARISNIVTIYDNKNEPTNYLNGYMVVEKKGLSSIESLLLTRNIMYDNVYYHKTTRGVEALFKLIVKRIKELGNKMTDLPIELEFLRATDNEQLQKFSKDNLLPLDDNYIYHQLYKWSVSSNDKILKDLCDRIINRNLLKPIEVPSGEVWKYENSIKKIIAERYDEEYYYYEDRPKDRPYIPIDNPLSDESKQQALRKNIFIKDSNNQCREASIVSEIIASLVRRKIPSRIYVPKEFREPIRTLIRKQ